MAIAPAYRASVSASVSASAATSSIRESRHQQQLTTQAVVKVCESFVTSSKEAVDTSAAEQPAIDALTHSADAVEGDSNGPLSQQLREALNAYNDAARAVANAIRAHSGIDQFNQRVNLLNDAKGEAVKRCRASL